MQGRIEKQVEDAYGEKLDSIAIALMKGNFRVTEIERSMNGCYLDTRLTLIVDGAEIDVELSKIRGMF